MVGIPQYLQDKANNGEIDATPRVGGGGPVEEGYYAMVVSEVEEDEKTSGPGANLSFTITRGPKTGVILKFNWFSFSESSAWKMIQLFDAAGFTYDSEFEELVDEKVEIVGYVELQPQTKGKNVGKMQNNVNAFHELNDDSLALLEEEE
jgi:hypothetical protein